MEGLFTPEEILHDDNLKTFSISDWVSFLSKKLSGKHSTKQYKVNPVYLYRGRENFDFRTNKTIEFFNHTRELWAPPHKKVKLGRCNVQGESMLYCSVTPTTIFFELNPSIGNPFTIIEYKISQEIEYISIIGWKRIIAASGLFGIAKGYDSVFKNHYDNCAPMATHIDGALSGIFQSNLTDIGREHIYRLTNAITRIFLATRGWGSNKHTPSLGLIYPSVQTEIPSINYAFKPSEVVKFLKPNIVHRYIILGKGEGTYAIQRTHETSRIFPNGELRWRKIDAPIEHITRLSTHLLK